MVVFVVKRYAVREAKKWRFAVRKAKIGRYARRKGVSPSLNDKFALGYCSPIHVHYSQWNSMLFNHERDTNGSYGN